MAVDLAFQVFKSDPKSQVMTREDLRAGAESLLRVIEYGWGDEFSIRVDGGTQRVMLASAVDDAFCSSGVGGEEGMNIGAFKALCEGNLVRLQRHGGDQPLPSLAVFALPFPLAREDGGRLAVFEA